MKVTMKGISMSFGVVRVLDSVDFSVAGGEIHALVLIDGEAVTIRSTRDAEALGIAIIHQELNMITQLLVMDNLFLGREPNHYGVIERGRMHKDAASWLSKVGAGRIDVNRNAETLSIGLQQLVEIAKTLSLNTRVLIMDEPTASLTDREIDTLFGVEELADESHVSGIHIEVRAGEVLGIAGLIGSGRSEILNTLFGVNRRTAGRVLLDERPLPISDPTMRLRPASVSSTKIARARAWCSDCPCVKTPCWRTSKNTLPRA